MTWEVWLSLGRGLGLYLLIALVNLEKSLRRIFLCSYALIKWIINIRWLYMLMILYGVGFMYEHAIGEYC